MHVLTEGGVSLHPSSFPLAVNHHSSPGEAGSATIPHLSQPGAGGSEAGTPETPVSHGTVETPHSATADFARAEWGFIVARSLDSPKDIGKPAFQEKSPNF